jgi:hypothetical protein
VNYTSNGAFGDYLLAVKGIISMSPELGTASKTTQSFFLDNFLDLKYLVQENYNWILYTIK